jgi:hypothetical protein
MDGCDSTWASMSSIDHSSIDICHDDIGHDMTCSHMPGGLRLSQSESQAIMRPMSALCSLLS